MSNTNKQFYPNMFPVGTIFEDTFGTPFRTLSVWEIHNGFFAVNAVELEQVGPDEYRDNDTGYVEIYPVWIKHIVKRGDGVVNKNKGYKYWELPVGTIFTVGGRNQRIGGTHTSDDMVPTQYIVYNIAVSSSIEVKMGDDDKADGVTTNSEYHINCGKVQNSLSDDLNDYQFNIVEVTSIIKRGDFGVKVSAGQPPTFRFNHPSRKKYYLARPYTTITMWLYHLLTKNYNLPHDVTINVDEFNKILKQSWVKTKYIKQSRNSDYIVDHYLIDRKRAAKWVKQNINRITMNIRTKELIQTKETIKAVVQAKQPVDAQRRMSLVHLDDGAVKLEQEPMGGYMYANEIKVILSDTPITGEDGVMVDIPSGGF